MKTTHTPGPWNVTRYGLQVYDKGANLIAKVETLACIGGTDDAAAQRASDQEQANARLIAAAPDLLAALEELLACPQPGRVQSPLERTKANKLHQDVCHRARAAIAKAKG